MLTQFQINPKQLLNFFLEITGNENNNISYIKNLIEVYPNVLDFMINDLKPDLSKVKYVKNKRYNYLKEKVKENYSILELNSLLKDAFHINILTKLKKHFENKIIGGTVNINDIILKSLKMQPYDTLCRLSGIGFIRADKILLEANKQNKDLWEYDLRYSIFRCSSFIIYYLINKLNGSTYMFINELKHQLYKFGLSDCINKFNEAIKDTRLKVFEDKIMLMSVYMEERNISNFIKAGLNPLIQKNWEIDINKYSSLAGFNLTKDQLSTLDSVNTKQLTLLNGYAGTGKSSSIKALINMLEDNGKSYVILAPTAKAAKTISKYTGRHASTIHWLLCHDFPNFDCHLDEDDYDNVSNLENYKDVKLGKLNYDNIIIDESSMLSVTLFNLLIRYIDFDRSKVLMIGDSFQLPSIQHGNLYHDMLSILDIPQIKLEEIFRYTEDGLITVATDIRAGRKYLTNELIQKIGDSYTFYEYSNINQCIIAALNKYAKLLETNNIEDVAILTAKNVGSSGTYFLNNCIQDAINPLKEWDDELKIKVDEYEIKFRVNDVIMNVKNNYNAIPFGKEYPVLIANGQTGIVKQVNLYSYSLIVEIDNEQYEFNYKDCCNLRLGYAFTIHKSQGSQWSQVIYIVTNEDSFMTSSNLLYVAVTRAQDNCYHFGNSNVINERISVQENLKRNTTLVEQYNNIW